MTSFFNQLTGIIPPIFRENKKEESVSGELLKKKIRYDNRYTNWSWRKKWLKNHPLKKWWELW
jgi:hypothetical protein